MCGQRIKNVLDTLRKVKGIPKDQDAVYSAIGDEIVDVYNKVSHVDKNVTARFDIVEKRLDEAEKCDSDRDKNISDLKGLVEGIVGKLDLAISQIAENKLKLNSPSDNVKKAAQFELILEIKNSIKKLLPNKENWKWWAFFFGIFCYIFLPDLLKEVKTWIGLLS